MVWRTLYKMLQQWLFLINRTVKTMKKCTKCNFKKIGFHCTPYLHDVWEFLDNTFPQRGGQEERLQRTVQVLNLKRSRLHPLFQLFQWHRGFSHCKVYFKTSQRLLTPSSPWKFCLEITPGTLKHLLLAPRWGNVCQEIPLRHKDSAVEPYLLKIHLVHFFIVMK